jgi:hypothetical protein
VSAQHPPDSESDCDDEDTFDNLPSRQPVEFWMRPSKLPEEAAAVGSDRALCDKCIALIAKSSLYGLTEHHMREEMALRFVRGHKLDGEDAVIEALQVSHTQYQLGQHAHTVAAEGVSHML